MSKIIKNNISYAGTEDNKVKQNETSIDAEYEVLLSGTADNTTRAEEARKSEALTFNPETGTLTIKNEDTSSALTVFGPYTSSMPAFTVSPDDEGGVSVQLFKSDMPAVFITAHNHTADPDDSEDEDRIGGEISLNGTSGFNTINLDGQTSTITVSNPSNAIPTITLNGANGGITATDGMVVPAKGQSYVNPTHKSAVYVPKTYQTKQWFPFAMTQTYNGGQWSIGTYDTEELLFVYTTKYNIDHNVNTNQVWRLQLNKNDNTAADNKIITSDGFTSTNVVNTNTLSEIFVRSSGGTAIEAAFRRWGKVCTLYLHFKTTATTSGGSNMIVGKAGSKVTPYLPPMTVTGGSYYSSMALSGHLGSDGSITVRNASGSNIGAQSSGFRMTWTWVY